MSNADNDKTDMTGAGKESEADSCRHLLAMKPNDWRKYLKPTFTNDEARQVDNSVPEALAKKVHELQCRYHHLVREKVTSGRVEGLAMDTPIYRTMPCRHFHSMVKSGKLHLANPMTWAEKFDQWERSPLSGGVFIKPTRDGERAKSVTNDIQGELMDWYAQSWSLTDECDAIWSRYARNGERAVRIATTPRKLLLAMCEDDDRLGDVYLRRVSYLSEPEIESRKVISWPMHKEESLRELLCMKRKAFAYEDEVRLLFWDREKANSQCRGKALEYPPERKMDLASAIESVCLDPDAPEECAEAEGAFMWEFGWANHVQISKLKKPSCGATVVILDTRC